MSETTTTQAEALETANDRFKRSFGNWFWGSMIAATVAHFLVFQLWPEMTAADFSFSATEMESIELPPEIDIPPPPERIARPATPVISEAVIDQDITIAPTTFLDNPVADLPPPPVAAAGAGNLMDAPTFTPMTVRPRILNEPEIVRVMEQQYPPTLRDAGIGGTVVVHFFVDERGLVGRTEISQSSGQPLLDQAALRVANVYRFSPAQNRDQIVPVWVEFPITFRVGM
jgi:periplasmic protein TonB